MKAVMVMFDSLNRHMLAPYGCQWTHTPNFARLAERTVTFTNSYVGSMPCMPARRELHTGRYNFLHRSWGPLEPFDDSAPEILKAGGVCSHLVTDHYHYWEDGGATYHTRYSSFETSRGQEGDAWKADLREQVYPLNVAGRIDRQDWVNRQHMRREEDTPQARTFAQGEEFLRTNAACDNWFLQIENFDPHEPYYVPDKYKELYDFDFGDLHFDWPHYREVTETPEQVEHIRHVNAALVSMCDAHLGKVLDLMDEMGLWDDTLLIVNTDHGFLLGEHDWWAKCRMPFWNEIAHTPLFIWDPRCPARTGRQCDQLVQTIDLPATLLGYFRQPQPADMQGVDLADTIAADRPVRQAALYGLHGAHVNVTDGRYTYMRAPCEDNTPLFNYTLMPTHMRNRFAVAELQDIRLAEPFAFTKGCRTMKIRSGGKGGWADASKFGTLVYDLQTDPAQQHPMHDEAVGKHMIELLVAEMKRNDAPPEQYERLGLDAGAA
jgi:arylsulfatase A-like enzyme